MDSPRKYSGERSHMCQAGTSTSSCNCELYHNRLQIEKNNVDIEFRKEPIAQINFQEYTNNVSIEQTNANGKTVTIRNKRKLSLVGDVELNKKRHLEVLLTNFSIYDDKQHLCPITKKIITDPNKPIYISGYMKSVLSQSIDCENDNDSVPVEEVGPIRQWTIKGLKPTPNKEYAIRIRTDYAYYYLFNPSDKYRLIFQNSFDKMWLSKLILDYLERNCFLQPLYTEVLRYIENFTIPTTNTEINEGLLHEYAQHVYNEIAYVKVYEFEDCLGTLPFMRDLYKIVWNDIQKPIIISSDSSDDDEEVLTRAVTTPLVKKTFESFFHKHLETTSNDLDANKKRFNENKELTQTDDESDSENDIHDSNKDRNEEKSKLIWKRSSTTRIKKIKWLSECIVNDEKTSYYTKVLIDGTTKVSIGDFVTVENSDPNIPPLIMKIQYMWNQKWKRESGYFHGEMYIRSTNTILGDVGNTRELFLNNLCYHEVPLSCIIRKVSVERIDLTNEHFTSVKSNVKDENLDDDGNTYFFKKCYNHFTARFEDLPIEINYMNEARKHTFCPSCERTSRKESYITPKICGKLNFKSELVTKSYKTEWDHIKWKSCEYKKGTGVFLRPGTFSFKNANIIKKSRKLKVKKVDDRIFTEYYRKNKNKVSNVDQTIKPFCVGYIAAVMAIGEGPIVTPQNMSLKVYKLYRPENTKCQDPENKDLNLVYWSDRICEVPFSAVVGPCQLIYAGNKKKSYLMEWLEKDPNRFYFNEAFKESTGRFTKVPKIAKTIGSTYIDNEKIAGIQNCKRTQINSTETEPLRTLDVFAGCGGLSHGLQQSGVAQCKWAIENEKSACNSYSLNHIDCVIYNEDCNKLLRNVINGKTHNKEGVRLPMKGEIQLLCGGPPCQGFSGMNRFNSTDYSTFQNSLIATYLSYCDYYRPLYFILENVRNFVTYKKGMILKLTLKALLDMGYQCTFGVLQAGRYGLPQKRRRLFILASLPGYKLPLYPEPTHVFTRHARSSEVTTIIDEKRFYTNIQWNYSAPRRTCSIRDAISDLPTISNGDNEFSREYDSEANTHFQRLMRQNNICKILYDHQSKTLNPLMQARVENIPKTPGSDWRDLPNISVKLSDNTMCKVLEYKYDDKKNGRSSTGALRGVCACAEGKRCSLADKQDFTLIPWCLPHTANRNSNWLGVYGRLDWDSYFSTTLTDPDPMGKQGRVLHPEQQRVTTIRECARSQGFEDSYDFCGTIQQKYRQIGNAVPPPLAAALGREILRAMFEPSL